MKDEWTESIGLTEEGFIREVALDCVKKMKDADKAFMCDNPRWSTYHFNYAMHIRNEYTYCRDFSDVDFPVVPDNLSTRILQYIFSLLLPDEYVFDDSFTDELFNRDEFIQIRIGYKEIFGHYPTKIITKYRSKALKTKYVIKVHRSLNSNSVIESDSSYLDYKYRNNIIDELIADIAERVWRINIIKKIAKQKGISLVEVEERINEIKKSFILMGSMFQWWLRCYLTEIESEKKNTYNVESFFVKN